MRQNTINAIINRVMIVSLVVVMITGVLLRAMPGMWIGILPGVSGITLTISIIIHCFNHRKKKR